MNQDNTSGFYKLIDIATLEYKYESEYVLEMVNNQVHKLTKLSKDAYQYPSNDWYWFDDEEDAMVFFFKDLD